jgi:signal transduction histidine kinase
MSQRCEQLGIIAPSLPFSGALLDCAADAVVEVDGDLRVVSWNAAAANFYEISAADAIGQRFTELITCSPSDLRSRRHAKGVSGIASALEEAGLSDGPATHVLAAGEHLPVWVSLIPVRARDGDSLYLLVIRDDAEQAGLAASLKKRLDFEMLLSELSARFSNLAEEAVDSEIELWLGRLLDVLDADRCTFAELDSDGLLNITHSCAMRGLDPSPRGPISASLPWMTQELIAGRPLVLSRIPEDLPPEAAEERHRFMQIGMKAAIGIPIRISGSTLCVLTFVDFRGPREWPRDLIARLALAGDAFGNAIARRAAKRRFDDKQLELVHVSRVAAMGELAAVIAHELDQPLTVIVSNAEAVRHTLHSAGPAELADADEALSEITDAAMRASEIVRRERKLLRKGPRGVAEAVDLNDAVREMELFVRADARQFGARVAMELVPGLPAVLGDRVQLQQVLLNLAHNALQAMRSQPGELRDVKISTHSGTNEVTLNVCDVGPPVDPLVLRRMFEPFYTTKAEGLGMGLSICKSIVDRHRGRIWATANPGGGLTMHVCLPRK